MTRKLITLLIITFSIVACNKKQSELITHNQTDIVGLASPVYLNPSTTIIHLSDYFIDLSRIDSIFIGETKLNYQMGSEKLTFIANKNTAILDIMKVWIKGVPFSILLRRSDKVKHTFTFDPEGLEYNQVRIKANFNGWNPAASELIYKDGKWTIDEMLNPGIYQYLYVLKGQEVKDPANPDSIDNNVGGFNSLLQIGNLNPSVPQLYTEEFEDNEIDLAFNNPIDDVFVFWENQILGEEFVEQEIDENEIEIGIPSNAKAKERSYIRVWASNKDGVSNDILIPLAFGKPISDPNVLTREDKESMIIYNIFVDRFFDGNPSNNFTVDDPEIKPEANYYGGDIEGIKQKVEEGFFEDLGVNTLWISPIVLNPDDAWGLFPEPRSKFSGYHGYWPISFTRIDYRYGTESEFTDLVNTSHKHALNFLIDFVANHVHQNHPVYIANPDWATELYLPDGSLNTERWDEYRLTTWFDVFLPSLDLQNPEVYEMLTDSAVYWIKKYKLDGFRHDATKHVPEIFWRTLTRKLKEQIVIPEERNIYQIGETYGNGELIGSYVNTGQLDAQFDFNVYDAAIAVFGKDSESFTRLNNTLKESFYYYGNHNLMGNISGNQDRARFISYAGGALGWEEDAKYAGWTREVGVGEDVGYNRLAMLHAFNMTIPGIPVIFYGDELGMPGGNDPDNRKWMKFDNLTEKENKLRETVKELAKIRKGNIQFIYGDFEVIELTDNVYVYARTYFDKIGIVVINKSDQSQEISFTLPARFEDYDLKSMFGAKFELHENNATISLNRYSFDILID